MENLVKLYEGKSKIVYEGTEPGTCVISYKDTATAGNGVKKEDLPGKGKLNAAISNIIFDYLAKNGVRTHLVRVIDDTTVLVRKADIVMVEVIVRNVAAGSFSKMINDSQITAIGVATQAELDELRAMALRVDELMTELFAKCGIRLVDFKLEFGRAGGELLLCDEISPDSCRLWDAETNRKMDKDRFRRDLGNVLDGYRDVLARLQAAHV